MKEHIDQIVKNITAVYISKSSYCIGPRGNIMSKLMDGLNPLREDNNYWVLDGAKTGLTFNLSIPEGEYQWKAWSYGGYIVSEGKKTSPGGWLSAKIDIQGVKIS